MKADHRFCDLPPQALAAFETIRYVNIFPKNAVLFSESHEARGVFLLCRGRVKLSFSSAQGKTIIMRIAEPGEMLGASATVSGLPYLVSAETIEPSQIAFIKRDDFLRFLNTHGAAAFAVTEQLAEKYMFACRELRSFNLAQSAAEKVAKLLLEWSARVGAADDREVKITLGLTHEEMGQMIGASRETVTRVLMELKKRQIVRARGNTLTIRDRNALKKLAAATEFIKLR
jgi:CRP/FNR family transcriptional regulator